MKRSTVLESLLAVMMGVANASGAVAGEMDDGLYARFVTSKGEILVRLHFEKVPMTVGNFVGLAEGLHPWRDKNGKERTSHFFDGLIFHRVLPKFMIQGGDPQGSGFGGPGYNFADEIHPDLTHDKPGKLSMANAGPNTNGSQFFITHVPTPWLDGKHAVFGAVVEGMDVVNAIQQGDKLEKVVILRVGKGAKGFDATKAFPAEKRTGE